MAHLNLTGDWNLTLRAAGSCGGVPNGLQTRTYTVRVTSPSSSPPYRGELSGAEFSYPQTWVYIGVSSTYASFYLPDEWNDYPPLVEKLAPSGFLALAGSGEGSVSNSSVSGSLRGTLDYCASGDYSRFYSRCEVNVVQCQLSAWTLVRRQ